MTPTDYSEFSLGKKDYEPDSRTLMMAQFLEVPVIPTTWDFDKRRAKFPVRMWGNNMYGDCVVAAESNHLLRMERVEQKRTIVLTDGHCILRYQSLTGCEKPGDSHDTGLVMLNAMKNWRSQGYQAGKRNYQISAFGELEPADGQQLRRAVYLLGGVHFGFALPISAQKQTNLGYWDVVTGPESQPGSWGGHAVFSCKYDQDAIYVQTWQREIKVTNSFVRRYCDEAWAVVDDLDKWRKTDALDIEALLAKLRSIGATNIE